MIDETKLKSIRDKVERYQFGKTIEIAANMKFLLTVIDELKEQITDLRKKQPDGH